jgi:hypothetical protein
MNMHMLHAWSQYLSRNDYNYMIQYIENVKNNIPNDEMIILSGESGTGKSALLMDIRNYLGDELFGYIPSYVPSYAGECFYYKDNCICFNAPRLVSICEVTDVSRIKTSASFFINLIKCNQSIIAPTNYIEKVNKNFLKYCRVITMTHVFV